MAKSITYNEDARRALERGCEGGDPAERRSASYKQPTTVLIRCLFIPQLGH